MKTRELLDAVTDRLEGLPIPTHYLFKYHRPLSLAGPGQARVPALAVCPVVDRSPLMATDGDNQWEHHFRISWYRAQMGAMTAGRIDEDLSGQMLDEVGVMIAEITEWETQLPGVDYQAQATVSEIHYGYMEGGIWCAEINIEITHWAQT